MKTQTHLARETDIIGEYTETKVAHRIDRKAMMCHPLLEHELTDRGVATLS